MKSMTWNTILYDGAPMRVAFDEGLEIDSPWSAMYMMGTLVLDGKATDLAATLTAGGRVIDTLSINDPAPEFGASMAAWSEAASIVQWIASEHYVMASEPASMPMTV